MSTKIAMTAHLPEHQECTACHCYTSAGYMLKDNSLSRFVCEECYSGMSLEYPVATKVVEINRRMLSSLVPEGKKPGFQAGYLMGKKDVAGSGYKITVSSFLDSVQADRGTTCFFGKDDALRIRKMSKDKDSLWLVSTAPVRAVPLISISSTTRLWTICSWTLSI